MKPREEANLLEFAWPTDFALFENIVEVLQIRDYTVVRAFFNSAVLTVFSVRSWLFSRRWWAGPSSADNHALERSDQHAHPRGTHHPAGRRADDLRHERLGIFATLPGLILIEIAFGLVLLRAAVSSFRGFGPTGDRRGRDHRRRRSDPPVLPGRVSASPQRHRHGHRGAVGRRVQRFRALRCTSLPGATTSPCS